MEVGGGQGSLLMFMSVNVEMVSRKARLSMRRVSGGGGGGGGTWPTRPLHWSGKSAISHVTSNPPPTPPNETLPSQPPLPRGFDTPSCSADRAMGGGHTHGIPPKQPNGAVEYIPTKAERSHTGPWTGGPG